MGKLDALRRSVGAHVVEASSQREADAGPVVAAPADPWAARSEGVSRSKDALVIPLDRIAPDPHQPRDDFEPESLARLAASLKARGQLQPIRVRWDEPSGRYAIICGERRWRAAALAGLPSLTCVVSDGPLDAGDLLALQLIENCVREDLQPVERARAYRALMERSGWSGNRLAQELGIAQSSVVSALALLDLPAAVRSRVDSGELAPSVAYEVSKIPDPIEQTELAARIVADGLSRADAIAVVRRSASKPKGRGAAARPTKPRVFRTAFGKATIEPRKGASVADVLRAALAHAEGQGGETEAA